MRFEYLTFLVYSPRGKNTVAMQSKNIEGRIKNGEAGFTDHLSLRLKENNLHPYFEDATLVPVPRSSPQVDGAVYPSLTIAENLVKNGIGNSVTDCLSRTGAIAKSSSKFSANQRNSVSTHLNSLIVKPLIISEPTIIIVDDILTLGRTAYASALLLKETYPDKEIKIFCPMRTRSFKEPESLTDIRRDFLRAGLNDNVQLPD